MEILPPSARPHLELQLDWGHGDVEKDLSEIANHMLDWEEKLVTHLELTPIDIHDLKNKYSNEPVLERLDMKNCEFLGLMLLASWCRREALRR